MILALAGVGAFVAGLYKIANTPQVSQVDITSWRKSNGQLLPEIKRSAMERPFLTLRQQRHVVSLSTAQPDGYVEADDVTVKVDGDQQPLSSLPSLVLQENQDGVPGRFIAGFAPPGVPSRSAFSVPVSSSGKTWLVDIAQPPKLPIGYVTEQKLVGRRWQPKVITEMFAFQYWLEGAALCEFGKARNVPGAFVSVGNKTLSSFLGRTVYLGCSGKPWTDFVLSAQKLFANSRDAQYDCILLEQHDNTIKEVYLLSAIGGVELPYNAVL